MRRVFDDFQIMAPADREDPIHIASLPGKMDRHHRAHSIRFAVIERLLDSCRINVQCGWVDIHEYRPRTQVTDYLRRRRECERRRDHLVALPDPQREQREMKCAGAMRDRERIACADVRREFALEAFHFWPCRNPSGSQRVEDFAFLVESDRGPMKGDLTHLCFGSARRTVRVASCWPLRHRPRAPLLPSHRSGPKSWPRLPSRA